MDPTTLILIAALPFLVRRIANAKPASTNQKFQTPSDQRIQYFNELESQDPDAGRKPLQSMIVFERDTEVTTQTTNQSTGEHTSRISRTWTKLSVNLDHLKTFAQRPEVQLVADIIVLVSHLYTNHTIHPATLRA